MSPGAKGRISGSGKTFTGSEKTYWMTRLSTHAGAERRAIDTDVHTQTWGSDSACRPVRGGLLRNITTEKRDSHRERKDMRLMGVHAQTKPLISAWPGACAGM